VSEAGLPQVPSVGLVGVGNMGGGMARRLLDLGWPVQVCDIDTARVADLTVAGAVAHDDAAGVARASDWLIVCVVDAAQTGQVLFGPAGATEALAARTRPLRGVLLCPTIAPDDVEHFTARLAAQGVAAIDAPMSGGPARARDGSMSLMVACPDSVFQEAQALLAALSSRLFRVGTRPGDGARTKLVNNLLAGINLVGAAEAMALAERIGLDGAMTLDVIEQSSGQSWIGSDRLRRALAGDFTPRAHVTLLEKDTRLAVEMARAVRFEGPLGERASAVFADAHARGLAAEDDGALLKLLRGDAS
jgi:L-threonate 2-dehydrogenase